VIKKSLSGIHLTFAERNRQVFSLRRKLKLNLNSRLVVIFVLRLAKPLSENTKRNRSAKVKVTQCIGRVSYIIYVSMRYYVLNTSGDIVVCFHTAVCLSC